MRRSHAPASRDTTESARFPAASPRRRWTSPSAGLFVAFAALAAFLTVPLLAGEEEPLCISDASGQLELSAGNCPAFETTAMRPARPASSRFDAAPRGDSGSRPPAGSEVSRAASLPGNEMARSPERTTRDAASRGESLSDKLLRIATASDEQAAMADFEELVAMGEPVVGSIIQVYRDANSDPRARWVAGRALGRIPSQASSDALIAGLKDAQPMARVAAARGLQDLGERRAVPALVKALNDPGAVVRAAVLDTLGTLGSSAEVKPVLAELSAPHNFIRGKGLFVRAHAATTLGKLGGDEAIDALIDLLDDRDEDTRVAARAALRSVTGRSTTPPGAGSEKERWKAWRSTSR